MSECPEDLVCFTGEEWSDFLIEYEVELLDEIGTGKTVGDAEAAINFTWELLFLSPWELAYIALPLTVLAFYGLTVYGLFKYIQRKFS
mgnify:CR=1 FL=1|jgi:hypothetical protein